MQVSGEVRQTRSGPGGQRGWRPTALGVLATAGSGALTVGLAGAGIRHWPGTGPVPMDAALTATSLVLAALLAGWLCLVLFLATLDVVPVPGMDRPTAATRRPRSVQIASATLISLAASLAAPTLASAGTVSTVAVAAEGRPGESSERAAESPAAEVPLPGWTPAPEPHPGTGGTAADVALVSSRPSDDLPEHVVVRRGDTLWDLAARHLGPAATSADIAQEWPRWYAANRDLIGADPDLILPGQELVVPGTAGVGP